MSNLDYITNLCFEISELGKTPSLALIRNMSQQPLAIPEVIKGLQHWKSNPNIRRKIQSNSIPSKLSSKQSLEERVGQLEKQVEVMMHQLAKISDEKQV